MSNCEQEVVMSSCACVKLSAWVFVLNCEQEVVMSSCACVQLSA